MVSAARVIGLLYMALGAIAGFGALLTMHNGANWELLGVMLGCFAVGALIGAVGEIGGLLRRISEDLRHGRRDNNGQPNARNSWTVTGFDRDGRHQQALVAGETRDDAYAAALTKGIVQVVSAERG